MPHPIIWKLLGYVEFTYVCNCFCMTAFPIYNYACVYTHENVGNGMPLCGICCLCFCSCLLIFLSVYHNNAQ